MINGCETRITLISVVKTNAENEFVFHWDRVFLLVYKIVRCHLTYIFFFWKKKSPILLIHAIYFLYIYAEGAIDNFIDRVGKNFCNTIWRKTQSFHLWISTHALIEKENLLPVVTFSNNICLIEYNNFILFWVKKLRGRNNSVYITIFKGQPNPGLKMNILRSIQKQD